MRAAKPAIHGRDHVPGGADPIPLRLTEVSPVWGRISRDGAAGNMSITSGSLNATTTLVQHNVVSDESGVDCDIVSTPTRIVILEEGLYAIHSTLVDLDTGAGDYGIAVGNGTNATGAIWTPISVLRRVLSGFGRPRGLVFTYLDAGDYLTQVVGQNSGSTKTFGYLANLTVVKIPGRLTLSADLGTIDGGAP